MQRSSLFSPRVAARPLAAVAAVALARRVRDDDTSRPRPRRGMFNQVQRLGNPLVSEVLLQKRTIRPTAASAPIRMPR